jgi:hypothetical protein
MKPTIEITARIIIRIILYIFLIYRNVKLPYNGLRVGDVALCCTCGRVMALACCHGLFKIIEMHESAFFHNKVNLTFHQII